MNKATIRHRCGLSHWTAMLLLAGSLALSGCMEDGKDGADGADGKDGADAVSTTSDPGIIPVPSDSIGASNGSMIGVGVTDVHGLANSAQAAKGANNPANLCTTITGASVDGTTGQLVVDFKVQALGTATNCASANGALYTTLNATNPAGSAQMTFRIAQLRSGDGPGDSSYWVNYTNALKTRSTDASITGPGTTPVGTKISQPSGESSYCSSTSTTCVGPGTWTNHGDGTYTYVTKTVLTDGITVPDPVLPPGYTGATPKSGTFAYDANLPHRVGLQMSDPDGTTGPATMGANTPTYDFIPATGPIADPREVVLVENCNECHKTLALHGSRLDTKLCVMCHNATNADPESGNSLDLKVMVHKIHMGRLLPSVKFDFAGESAGIYNNDPEGAVKGTPYRIIGSKLTATTFNASEIGFPANVATCTKCHKGATQGDNWKTKPTREVCGSCHDGINFDAGIADPNGMRLGIANPFPGSKITGSIDNGTGHLGGIKADNSGCTQCHDASDDPQLKVDTNIPVATAHNMAVKTKTDYDVAVTMTQPANGTHYVAGEKPVVTVVLTDKATGSPIDHSNLTGISANLYVYGPRAEKKPVLTTAAKSATGSTAGNSLSSTTDTKVTRTAGNITYALDDVSGLQPGTYFIFVRVNKSGTKSSESHVLKEFQIGTATPEKQVAVCTTCHENTMWHDSPGAGGNHPAKFDPDWCGACHDYKAAANAKLGLLVDGSYTMWKGGGVCVNDGGTPGTSGGADADDTVDFNNVTQNDCLANENRRWSGSGCVADGVVVNAASSAACTTAGGTWTSFGANNMGFGAAPIARRVHGVHAGKAANSTLTTMNYPFEIYNGHNVSIVFPQDVKNCETCHTAATTGTWATKGSRLACLACHDSGPAQTHGALMTVDATPYANAEGTLPGPFSGDESESCPVCHN